MNSWILPTFMTFICWGITTIISKVTLEYINPISAMIYRTIGVFAIAFIALFILDFKPDVHAKGITLSIVGGLIFGFSLIIYYYALKLGKVSTVVIFTAMYPVIPILFGYFILKEPVALKEGIGIVFDFTYSGCLGLPSLFMCKALAFGNISIRCDTLLRSLTILNAPHANITCSHFFAISCNLVSLL